MLGVQCRLGEGRAVQVSASCCDGLDVRRCGRDQQRDDMADQTTELFSCDNDDAVILSRPSP